MVKLDNFFFLYPPNVKRTFKRIGVNEIEVVGVSPTMLNLGDLREVCRSIGPMLFRTHLRESEVVVKDYRSKGLRYWIQLLEYVPLAMKVRDRKDGSFTDIGRTMFHPRFELCLPSDKISPKSLWLLRWSIRVKVNKDLSARFLFDDMSSEANLGIRASVNDNVKFYAGYEDKLEEIYSGKINKLRHTLKGKLDFLVESNIPDPVPNKPQTIEYHLDYPGNVFSASALSDANCFTREVSAPGLPSLKPGDAIWVFSTHPGFEDQRFYLADEVDHCFTRGNGFVTRLTLKQPSSSS